MKFYVKIFLIGAILFMVGALFCLRNAVYKINSMSEEIATEKNEMVFNEVVSDLETTFNNVELISNFVCSKDAFLYVNRCYALREAKEAEETKSKIDKQIMNFQIGTEPIKSIYLIGANRNQKSYVIHPNAEEPFIEYEIPHCEIWHETGLFENIYKYDGGFTKIERNFLTHKLGKEYASFIDDVSDEFIYLNVKETFYVLIVLNEQLPVSIYDTTYQQHILEITDVENNILWHSKPEIMYKEPGLKQSIYQKDLDKFGIKIAAYKSKLLTSNLLGKSMEKLLPFTIGFVCIVMILLFVSAKKILEPLKSLTQQFSLQSFDEKIDHINNYTVGSKKRWGIRKKIGAYYFLGIFIPLFILNTYYSIESYYTIKAEIQSKLTTITKLIKMNIEEKMASQETLIRILGGSEIYSSILSRPLTKVNNLDVNGLEQQLFRVPKAVRDIDYFVLLDDRGKAIYQTVYSGVTPIYLERDDVSTFSISEEQLAQNYSNKQEKDVFWITNKEDIFAQRAVSVVKPFYSHEGTVIGYLKMVIRPSTFDKMLKTYPMECIVTNKERDLVYTNSIYKEFYDVKRIQEINEDNNRDGTNDIESTVKGINYSVQSYDLKGCQWYLTVFSRLDEAMRNSYNLFMSNLTINMLICILCFAGSYILGYLVLKPLKVIEEHMLTMSINNEPNILVYRKDDEIGQLVTVYNRMVERIKALTHNIIESQTREERLKTLKIQAELDMLQQQINPHFLYNTLELIDCQVQENKDVTSSKMLRALSDIFRFANTTKGKTVLVEEEITHVKNYIMIQKMRFKEKFEVDYDIDQEALKEEMLKLLIQPLVENAINHGLYEMTSGGRLLIRVKKIEDKIHIVVSDNGVGMSKKDLKTLDDKIRSSIYEEDLNPLKQKRQKHGVALGNIYKRLYYYYGQKSFFEIQSQLMKGTKVLLVFPIRIK